MSCMFLGFANIFDCKHSSVQRKYFSVEASHFFPFNESSSLTKEKHGCIELKKIISCFFPPGVCRTEEMHTIFTTGYVEYPAKAITAGSPLRSTSVEHLNRDCLFYLPHQKKNGKTTGKTLIVAKIQRRIPAQWLT